MYKIFIVKSARFLLFDQSVGLKYVSTILNWIFFLSIFEATYTTQYKFKTRATRTINYSSPSHTLINYKEHKHA